jgi:hypothetical protein
MALLIQMIAQFSRIDSVIFRHYSPEEFPETGGSAAV